MSSSVFYASAMKGDRRVFPAATLEVKTTTEERERWIHVDWGNKSKSGLRPDNKGEDRNRLDKGGEVNISYAPIRKSKAAKKGAWSSIDSAVWGIVTAPDGAYGAYIKIMSATEKQALMLMLALEWKTNPRLTRTFDQGLTTLKKMLIDRLGELVMTTARASGSTIDLPGTWPLSTGRKVLEMQLEKADGLTGGQKAVVLDRAEHLVKVAEEVVTALLGHMAYDNKTPNPTSGPYVYLLSAETPQVGTNLKVLKTLEDASEEVGKISATDGSVGTPSWLFVVDDATSSQMRHLVFYTLWRFIINRHPKEGRKSSSVRWGVFMTQCWLTGLRATHEEIEYRVHKLTLTTSTHASQPTRGAKLRQTKQTVAEGRHGTMPSEYKAPAHNGVIWPTNCGVELALNRIAVHVKWKKAVDGIRLGNKVPRVDQEGHEVRHMLLAWWSVSDPATVTHIATVLVSGNWRLGAAPRPSDARVQGDFEARYTTLLPKAEAQAQAEAKPPPMRNPFQLHDLLRTHWQRGKWHNSPGAGEPKEFITWGGVGANSSKGTDPPIVLRLPRMASDWGTYSYHDYANKTVGLFSHVYLADPTPTYKNGSTP